MGKAGNYHFALIDDLLADRAEWRVEQPGKRYFYQASAVLELDSSGLLTSYGGDTQQPQLLPDLSFDPS
jgi:hypothetical protein